MPEATIEIARNDKYKITLTDVEKPSFNRAYHDENGAVYTTNLHRVFRTDLVDSSWMNSDESHLLYTETRVELWGDQVVGLYPNGDVAFLLDASILVSEGHEHKYQLELTSLNSNWDQFALTVKKHGTTMPYHLITDADMRSSEQEACGDTTISWSESYTCAREVEHQGKHMSYGQHFQAKWSAGGGQFTPWGTFGIVRRCEHCDTPVLDRMTMCDTCAYWYDQKSASGRMVVRGNHFRSAKTGIFSDNAPQQLRNIETGEVYDGPLANQGMIPEVYRHMFPNTHEPLGQWYWPQDEVR
jgi:hypothetical protein